MTEKTFLLLLDELLELDPGTIKGNEPLTQFSGWNSLAIIGFIALIDQHFGVSVPGVKIIDCKTVSDLTALVREQLQS